MREHTTQVTVQVRAKQRYTVRSKRRAFRSKMQGRLPGGGRLVPLTLKYSGMSEGTRGEAAPGIYARAQGQGAHPPFPRQVATGRPAGQIVGAVSSHRLEPGILGVCSVAAL